MADWIFEEKIILFYIHEHRRLGVTWCQYFRQMFMKYLSEIFHEHSIQRPAATQDRCRPDILFQRPSDFSAFWEVEKVKL